MKKHKFTKEFGRWYIDYPEYIKNGGQKVDLLMVCGADTMLEKFSNGKNEVTLEYNDKPFEADIELKMYKHDSSGGYYKTNRPDIVDNLWLCNVTKSIFNGKHPWTIYIKVDGTNQSKTSKTNVRKVLRQILK